MNNIEILEEFIKHYKEVQEKYKDDEIQAEIERSCYFEEVPAEAIENLIQENKELEEYISKEKFIEMINSIDFVAIKYCNIDFLTGIIANDKTGEIKRLGYNITLE